jgi:hypothetical protein
MNEEFDRHEEFIMSEEETRYDKFHKEMETKFPKMFSEPYGGFACGEGWWPILESLCVNIQGHIDWKNKTRSRLLENNPYEHEIPNEVAQVVVRQIKEKFGGLRFYYDGGDDAIGGMVRMAESWAGHTCEDCGSPATKQTSGWIKTVCDMHYEEHEERKRKSFEGK